MKITQCQRILDYIKQFGSISTLEAFNDLGVARLASRIHDLKDRGHRITSEMVTKRDEEGNTKCRYAVYRLKED